MLYTYVYVYMYICTHTYIMCMYIHIYIYIYTHILLIDLCLYVFIAAGANQGQGGAEESSAGENPPHSDSSTHSCSCCLCSKWLAYSHHAMVSSHRWWIQHLLYLLRAHVFGRSVHSKWNLKWQSLHCSKVSTALVGLPGVMLPVLLKRRCFGSCASQTSNHLLQRLYNVVFAANPTIPFQKFGQDARSLWIVEHYLRLQGSPSRSQFWNRDAQSATARLEITRTHAPFGLSFSCAKPSFKLTSWGHRTPGSLDVR